MNKERRTRLSTISGELSRIADQIEAIKEQEDASKDNMEGLPQFDGKVIDIEMNVGDLEDVVTSVRESADTLREIVNN